MQCFANLLSNAFKFCDGTEVKCFLVVRRTSETTGEVVFEVKDGGRGLTASELKTVMVPFGQVRKAGEENEGTGLGLSLTRMMLENHGGSLRLTSEGAGKGVTATARILVGIQELKDSSDAPRPTVESSQLLDWVQYDPETNADVLIVDDVKVNRTIVIRNCEKLNLTCDAASDGMEAVSILSKNTYSLVIMDMEMPEMSGDIAVRAARKAGYKKSIIILSGNSVGAMQDSVGDLPVQAFITKMGKPSVRDILVQLQNCKSKHKHTNTNF